MRLERKQGEKSFRRLWRLIFAFLRLRQEIMFHRRSLVVAWTCVYACIRVLTSTRPSLHDNLYNVIIGGYVSTRRGRGTFRRHKYAIAIAARYFAWFTSRDRESQSRVVERRNRFTDRCQAARETDSCWIAKRRSRKRRRAKKNGYAIVSPRYKSKVQ